MMESDARAAAIVRLAENPWLARTFNAWNAGSRELLHRLLTADVDPCALFDRAFYLAQNPDVADSGGDPVRHYFWNGSREGRDPGPLFDSDWYLQQNPDVESAGDEPLEHYQRSGAREGRDPSPLFDARWYGAVNSDVVASGLSAAGHYARFGHAEGRDAYPADGPQAATAVVAHCFYPDLWRELAEVLTPLADDIAVYVTVPSDAPGSLLRQIEASRPGVHLRKVANRGRDVGAFLAVLPEVLDAGHALVGKIHSKKGRTHPALWRRMCLMSLMGSAQRVSDVRRAFARNRQLKLAGPRFFYISGPTFIGGNAEALGQQIRDVYAGRPGTQDWGFFAGTMFWASADHLRPFAAYVSGGGLEALLASGDEAANDGQPAHAMERLFGLGVAIEGGDVGLLDLDPKAANFAGVTLTPAPGRPSHVEIADRLAAHDARVGLHDLRVRQGRLAPPRPIPHARTFKLATAADAGTREIALLGCAAANLEAHGWRRDDAAGAAVVSLAGLSAGRPPPGNARYAIGVLDGESLAVAPSAAARLVSFDLLLAPSDLLAEAAAAACDRPVARISVAPKNAQSAAAAAEAAGGRKLFLVVAEGGRIKPSQNLLGMVAAYERAFGEDDGAFCTLLTAPDARLGESVWRRAAQRTDIRVVEGELTSPEGEALLAQAHALIWAPQADGVGLTLAHALARGAAVVGAPVGVGETLLPGAGEGLRLRAVEGPDGAAWRVAEVDDLAAALRAAAAARPSPAAAVAALEADRRRAKAQLAAVFSGDQAGAAAPAAAKPAAAKAKPRQRRAAS